MQARRRGICALRVPGHVPGARAGIAHGHGSRTRLARHRRHDHPDLDVLIRSLPGETVEGTVPAGGTSSSDSLGAGPTSANPLTSAVITPNPGFVRITEGGLGAALPSGFEPLASPIVIVAPDASSDKPLGIVIRLDASVIPPGTTLGYVTVLRDGVAAGECAGGATANSVTARPLEDLAARRRRRAGHPRHPRGSAGTSRAGRPSHQSANLLRPVGSPAAALCRVPNVTGMKVGGCEAGPGRLGMHRRRNQAQARHRQGRRCREAEPQDRRPPRRGLARADDGSPKAIALRDSAVDESGTSRCAQPDA